MNVEKRNGTYNFAGMNELPGHFYRIISILSPDDFYEITRSRTEFGHHSTV